MTPVSRTEIAPEQKATLDELRDSIRTDTDAKVQAEAVPLQNAIDRNDRAEVMTALRTLEVRLESLAAVDRHREKLKQAKSAIGYVTDSIDTAVGTGIDAVKGVTVDPVVRAITSGVPGAADAMKAAQPSIDAAKEAYAKLPTALRLPILGAVIAGGSWLASFPVKWLGKLVGYVSENGEKAIETLADSMKTAGKIAFVGGFGLGAASFVGGKYREGAFDPTIEAIKGKPGAPAPAPATKPPAAPGSTLEKDPSAPTYTNEQLFAGVNIEGTNVKVVDGNTIEVAGEQWTFGNSFAGNMLKNASVGDGGILTVNASVLYFPKTDSFTWKTVKTMVRTLATATTDTVPVIGNDGNPYMTPVGPLQLKKKV